MNSTKFFHVILIYFVCASGALSVTNVYSAEKNYKAEITEIGYYKKVTDLERERNLAATSGYVRTGGEVELEAQTSEVPLKLNRLFGFKFRIEGFEGKDAVQLKLVVQHPVITRPNGSTSNGYSYPVVLEVKNGVIENQSGYSIDHEYEMVEGDWIFEYWYNEHKLLSQSFTTVKTPAESGENSEVESVAPAQESQVPEDQSQEKQLQTDQTQQGTSMEEPPTKTGKEIDPVS